MNESSALQPVWNWMLGQLGVGFFEFPLYFLPVVVVVVLVTGVFFSILDVAVYRKISAKTAWKLGVRVMANYVGSTALLLVLDVKFHPWALEVPSAATTLMSFVAQVALLMIMGEFLTYWWHRLEHGNRFVFKYVHYMHHRVESPLTIWTNFVVHPVEGLMVMLCLYVPPLVLGVHPLVMVAYAIANTTAMVITHCGYDIRFYPSWLLPPAVAHELHHSEKRPTNLSVVMSYGDKFFGTYKKPVGIDTPVRSEDARLRA